jgi:sulfur-oxidizing protein SoxX
MKFLKTTAVAMGVACIVASSAIAGPVAPMDVSFDDGAVNASLTGVAGDPVAGGDTFKNRKLGNCLACHVNSAMPNESFQGEVGPPLDGVADRYNEAELRGIVSNSKMVFEDTIMPGFYVDSGLTRPLKDFDGVPILTAQEVEDVVAYLQTLKE